MKNKWHKIDAVLTHHQIRLLFAFSYVDFMYIPTLNIPFSSSHYRWAEKLLDLGLVELGRSSTHRKGASKGYRRTIREIRITSDGEGGIIINVR